MPSDIVDIMTALRGAVSGEAKQVTLAASDAKTIVEEYQRLRFEIARAQRVIAVALTRVGGELSITAEEASRVERATLDSRQEGTSTVWRFLPHG